MWNRKRAKAIPTSIVCGNGHIWDVAAVVDHPQVRGHIVQCPFKVNPTDPECGARIVWKNPVPIDKKNEV